jgi:hypothetical protein
MRIPLLLLLLVVSAPVARAQAPRAGDDAVGKPAAQVEEKRISDEEAQRLIVAPLAAGRTAARELAIVPREQAATDAQSQSRGEDFLWQVLLITVSALITALVWKWVND